MTLTGYTVQFFKSCDYAAQNAATVAELQNALEEQKQLTAQAIADAAAQSAAVSAPAASYDAPATSDTGAPSGGVTGELTTAQRVAAENGVSADLLVREQITGQIYSKIEDAEIALKALKTTMQTVFDYAGCDSKGDNCAGPKRVKVFKERAMQFFEPYDDVLDDIYEALISAQTVGVDITDIYMMLNDSCNAWGLYLCQPGQIMHYTADNCQNGRSVPKPVYEQLPGQTKPTAFTAPLGKNTSCSVGQVVPLWDGGCQLTSTLNSKDADAVQRNWLYQDEGETGGHVRMGCASEALNTSALFSSRSRKKQAMIGVDILERIIEQDAPTVYGAGRRGYSDTTPEKDGLPYCAITEKGLQELQKAAAMKQLPAKICKTQSVLKREFENNGPVIASSSDSASAGMASSSLVINSNCSGSAANSWECKCTGSGGMAWNHDGMRECRCAPGNKYNSATGRCEDDPSGAGNASGYDVNSFNDLLSGLSAAAQECRKNYGYYNTTSNKCECKIFMSDDYDACVRKYGNWSCRCKCCNHRN